MTDKRLFVILLAILALSVALLVYAKTHVGQNFIDSF